jgi:hypothetical protein
MSVVTFAQTGQKIDPDKKRLDSVCDRFMKSFETGNFSEAMQLLKQNTNLAPSTIDSLENKIIYQFKTFVQPTYGKILSSEFVSEHKIKNIIAKRFYILKLEKYYLKIEFTMYNNGSSWTITSFVYNEDLIELLY